jgi:PTS system mannose-specific IIA component
MSVGIVVITHGQVGAAIIKAAEFILDCSLEGIRLVPFTQLGAHPTGHGELKAEIDQSDEGDGVLVLTDLVGASPANLVSGLIPEIRATAVTGLNLAMLLRVWNYRDLPLDNLAKKAVTGGKRGIEAINS